MRTRSFVILTVCVWMAAAAVEAQMPCASVGANTERVRGAVIERCPADFETVWLTLLGCRSVGLPNGLIVVAPETAQISHHDPPQRVMWTVNGGNPSGRVWTISWKDVGNSTQSKNIFPGAGQISATGQDSFVTGQPTGTTMTEKTYQYAVEVEVDGNFCARIDPQIVLKDDPPPPPPPDDKREGE